MVSKTGVVIENSNIGPCGGTAGSQTNATSIGINISGNSSGNAVYDSYIHTETNLGSSGSANQHIGIFDHSASGYGSNIFKGNVVAYGDQEIVIDDSGLSSDSVVGNMTLNPNGDQFASSAVKSAGNNQGNGIQVDAPSTGSEYNLMIACRTTGASYGNGIACSSIPNFASGSVAHDSYACDDFIFNDTAHASGTADVENNYVIGGGERESGTAYNMRAGGESFTRKNNIFVDAGGGGGSSNLYSINMGASGSTFSGDLGFQNQSGNNASSWIGPQGSFGPWTNFNVTGSNNKIANVQSNGTYNGEYCGGSSCSSVLNETNDTWGSGAWPTLNQSSTVTQIEAALGTPPLIPPLPKNCIVNSPFTTQTQAVSGVPPC